MNVNVNVSVSVGMDAPRDACGKLLGKVGHVVGVVRRGLRLTACRRVCLAATGRVCYRIERYAVLSRSNNLQLCDTTGTNPSQAA